MASSSERSLSTSPQQPTAGWNRFDRVLRVLSMGVIVVIVLGALLGVAGLRTSSASGTNGAIDVVVTYAEVTRPGISTPFRIEVTSTTGEPLPAQLTIEIGDDYLSMFDENGVDPAPDFEYFDGEALAWTYEVDDETTLVVDFDARLQPNIHRGRDASVTVSGPDSEPVVIRFHTTVFA